MKKIIGIVGSLRAESYNKFLMQAVKENAPQSMEIEILDVTLPLFNADLESAFPIEATFFKEKIKAADGIIIATPEYNRSIPGVLKNAIDWASRPYGDNAFAGKPVFVMGASTGAIGTAVAQSHLKQILSYLDTRTMGQPEFYLGNAKEKFDAAGKLADEKTREYIIKGLEAFEKLL
jgi:NAD(P)H-dependent FMN reductase